MLEHVITFSPSLKKETTNEMKCIEQDIVNLERQHYLTKDPNLLMQIDDLKLKYNSINTYTIKLALKKSELSYLEQGEMAGK